MTRRSSRLATFPTLNWEDTVGILSDINTTEVDIYNHYTKIRKYHKNDETKVSKYIFENHDDILNIFCMYHQTNIKFMALICSFIGLKDDNVVAFLDNIPEAILSRMDINRASNGINTWYKLRTGLSI